MAAVVLKNLSKRFKEHWVVRGVDLEVRDGEFLVLVGPSGCGKSTTLRMVAGLEEISEGELTIGGRLMNQAHPKDRDIAMVFQSYALYPHLDVRENMSFGLKMRGMRKAEIDTRVREAAEILGLTDLLGRKPKELSGGQRQRVAMGRAIVRKPQVFLFDEPLSNLDAKLRVQMRSEIAKLHQRIGTTILYVTHDQVEAMTLADRIAVMDRGVLQQVGRPLELFDHPKNRFVAGFIGSPAMNFIPCILDDRARLCGEGFALELPSEHRGRVRGLRGAVELGLRPNNLKLVPAEPARTDRLHAAVEVREPLGSETFVYLKRGEGLMVVREEAHTPVKVGETVGIALNLARAHLFDAGTQEAIF
jgi:multiple sugar transport system ATP-binding protein